MELNELTEEQKAKMQSATSPEELLALIEAEGIELTDEEMDSISGGSIWGNSGGGGIGYGIKCPECGSSDVRIEYDLSDGPGDVIFRCYGCWHAWIGPDPCP